MGRKAKRTKRTITVVVNGAVIPVILHPPPPRGGLGTPIGPASWPASPPARQISSGRPCRREYGTERWKRPCLAETLLSDEEFEAIQRGPTTTESKTRRPRRGRRNRWNPAWKPSPHSGHHGISPMTLANPDDLPPSSGRHLASQSWRLRYPKARKKGVNRYSPHTVLRWSRSLQAAFERANINGGKKCIRGVVANDKLLTANPWRAFTWIEGADKPIRQFTADELGSILDYFGSEWQEMSVAPAAAKSFLWLWCRLSELVNL